ncbi:MAG: 1-deoxy-D-xylulose-5-phosphate synthase [Cryobacterium sp.]|nr:1-deoxy-D-xylulose-5-phosphate synthase [Oligoflexia bacterium]
MLLGRLKLPAEIRTLNVEELEILCDEIRQEIIAVSLRNGGHLGASLGAVEIAVALHRIFESPKDKMIWDVGHQAYAHKLITGRANRFSTLRKSGGISGFLSRAESEHDAFGAGHSSTALSAALGFAYRSDAWTLAVVGDGGLSAGVAFEALNNIQSPNYFGPMIIILNDNQMSISENVGGLHHILENGQAAEYFQMFGLEYVGPMSGHDLPTLLATLNGIKAAKPTKPILLHLLTQKGKGYSPAESQPALYHGVGPAQSGPVDGKTKAPEEVAAERTWSDLFCDALLDQAAHDPKILGITAAMADGTGLLPFAKKFPERFFDVGIAEAHGATFAAGLAANGWKPVCAIYSTFLQRAFDAIIHDIALQELPVIFGVDRAGLVGADGPTHHGVFDLAYGGMVPGLRIYTPEVGEDIEGSFQDALGSGKPTFIRYPRGKASLKGDVTYAPLRGLDSVTPLSRQLIVTFGPIGIRVRKIISSLSQDLQNTIAHVSVIQAKPIPEALIQMLDQKANQFDRVLYFEDGIHRGSLSVDLASRYPLIPAHYFDYPDIFLPHGTVPEIEQGYGFTDDAVRRVLQA